MTFGEKLKYIRCERGYSQEFLSGLSGFSRRSISYWENEKKLPKDFLCVAKVLGTVFKIRPDYFFTDLDLKSYRKELE